MWLRLLFTGWDEDNNLLRKISYHTHWFPDWNLSQPPFCAVNSRLLVRQAAVPSVVCFNERYVRPQAAYLPVTGKEPCTHCSITISYAKTARIDKLL